MLDKLASPQDASPKVVWGFVLGCYVLTMLVLLPWQPGMPGGTIDSSWQDALNVAAGNHLRFGKDLVVDFGPLAPALTHQYSPATDTLMLLAAWALSSAVFLGFALLAMPGWSTWLLAVVPLVLSQVAGRE